MGLFGLQGRASTACAAAAGARTKHHMAWCIGAKITVMARSKFVLHRVERSQHALRPTELEELGVPRIGNDDGQRIHGLGPTGCSGAHCATLAGALPWKLYCELMSDKLFISADSLLADSFELAARVLESGYRPSFIVALWRGGAPIGIAVQEFLEHRGLRTDHIAVRTSSYTGIDRQEKTVRVHAMDYLVSQVTPRDRLLIVDDVFDSGRSLEAVMNELQRRCPQNYPAEVRIATVYYKPTRNRSSLRPDWYVHSTERWLVFPHELVGLSDEEIATHKPAAARLR